MQTIKLFVASWDTECTAVSPGLLDWYDYAPDVPKRIEIAVPPKPRAKAAAARSAPVRMRLRAKTPEPPPALGCSKCRYAVNGCAVCKARRAKVVAGILKPLLYMNSTRMRLLPLQVSMTRKVVSYLA